MTLLASFSTIPSSRRISTRSKILKILATLTRTSMLTMVKRRSDPRTVQAPVLLVWPLAMVDRLLHKRQLQSRRKINRRLKSQYPRSPLLRRRNLNLRRSVSRSTMRSKSHSCSKPVSRSKKTISSRNALSSSLSSRPRTRTTPSRLTLFGNASWSFLTRRP